MEPMNAAQVVHEVEGLTYRQVDYYCSHGLLGEALQSPGGGHPRTFTEDDVRVLRVLASVAKLQGGGSGIEFSIDVKRSIVEKFRQAPFTQGWIVITCDGNAVVESAEDVTKVHPWCAARVVIAIGEAS